MTTAWMSLGPEDWVALSSEDWVDIILSAAEAAPLVCNQSFDCKIGTDYKCIQGHVYRGAYIAACTICQQPDLIYKYSEN